MDSTTIEFTTKYCQQKQRKYEYYITSFAFNNTEINEGYTLWHLARLFSCKFEYAVYHAFFNPLNAELSPIRHLLALAGDRHFVETLAG
jgi:hypothetical protein